MLSWAPKRHVFLRRTLIVSAITFVTFLVLLASALWVTQNSLTYLGVGALMPFVLTLILFIDDLMRWRQVRSERWAIADGHMMHDGPDGRATVPLTEIASVKRRIGGSVVIKLHAGQRIVMRYLPYPDETASQIDAARPPDTP